MTKIINIVLVALALITQAHNNYGMEPVQRPEVKEHKPFKLIVGTSHPKFKKHYTHTIKKTEKRDFESNKKTTKAVEKIIRWDGLFALKFIYHTTTTGFKKETIKKIKKTPKINEVKIYNLYKTLLSSKPLWKNSKEQTNKKSKKYTIARPRSHSAPLITSKQKIKKQNIYSVPTSPNTSNSRSIYEFNPIKYIGSL